MKLNPQQLNTIKQLGLSDIQTKLYVTSLENGMLTVLELSKLTKLSRQKIYEEAETLVDLGLYNITRKQGRKYIPAHPSKLIKVGQNNISQIQSTLEEVSQLIPILESGNVSKKNKVGVKYYEGKDRLKKIYADELEQCQKTEVLSLVGSYEDITKFFSDNYWNKWNKQFVTQGSKSKILMHGSSLARKFITSDKKYNRETRLLKNFSLKSNIDIFNNTVIIVSYYDELGIWIDSRMLADSYRIMFNSLWSQA